MKIAGITACVAGIAHTYMAREKLIKGAKARGHECRVEIRGTIGTEYRLAKQEIAETDVVIPAVDVKTSDKEQLKRKSVIRADMVTIIKNATGFIEKVEKAMENKG